MACRLDAILSALSKAKGKQLVNPWPIIHPNNDVRSLSEALHPKHDAYYQQLPKFKFLGCLDHYQSGASAPDRLNKPSRLGRMRALAARCMR